MTKTKLALKNTVYVGRPNQSVVNIRFEGIKSGWKQRVLLTSDRHHDSTHCDRAMEKKHLDEAKASDAIVLDFGDLFDVMQGRGDPRGNYSDVRPEYAQANYLDLVIRDAKNFYKPYARNIVLLARGNHETRIAKEKDTDITDRLVSHLRDESKDSQAIAGQYSGWVLFQFLSGKQESKRLYYNHGTGGESAATFGVGQVRKQAAFLDNVDFVVNGHSHHAYHVPMIAKGVSQNGAVYDKLIHGIRTPGYKRVFRDEHMGGFEVQSGHVPKPVGAVWLEFTYNNGNIESKVAVDVG